MSKLSKELKMSSSLSTELEGLLESAGWYQVLIAGFRYSRGYSESADNSDVSCFCVGIEFSTFVRQFNLELVEWLLHRSRNSEVKPTEHLGKCSVASFDWSNDMERTARVQRMAYRRMEQIDSELERFEERPELDTRRRYGLLLRRFEELERLYYHLRRDQAPKSHQLIERIVTAQSTQIINAA